MLNKFDTTQASWEGWNYIAFILIFLKKIKKRGKSRLLQFIEEIWLERLRELPYEMKQLSDTVRTNYYPVYKNSTLRSVSLQEAITPQGKLLEKPSCFLPRPTP